MSIFQARRYLPTSKAREQITAARTYYVRTDGSDSNTGLLNTAAGAFLTLQKAWNTIRDTLDLRGNTVTVQIGDGTYTGQLAPAGMPPGWTNAASIVFQGNSGTPANVIISTTSAHAIDVGDDNGEQASLTVKDLELRTTTSGSCLRVLNYSAVLFQNIRFGVCANAHIESHHSSYVKATGNYAVTGNAQFHIQALSGSLVVIYTRTITYSNTPAFSTANFLAYYAQIYCASMTFTNGATVTGTRYLVSQNGMINTEGGGANYIPGDVAGTASVGGIYV